MEPAPASVTVVADTCTKADAWATALMVLGAHKGAQVARDHALDAMFLLLGIDGGLRSIGVGGLFADA